MNTAKDRRDAITAACNIWIHDARLDESTQDEADIRFEEALFTNGVLQKDDAIYEIWADTPETLLLRVNGSTIIEIDVESGNFLRGEADE